MNDIRSRFRCCIPPSRHPPSATRPALFHQLLIRRTSDGTAYKVLFIFLPGFYSSEHTDRRSVDSPPRPREIPRAFAAKLSVTLICDLCTCYSASQSVGFRAELRQTMGSARNNKFAETRMNRRFPLNRALSAMALTGKVPGLGVACCTPIWSKNHQNNVNSSHPPVMSHLGQR